LSRIIQNRVAVHQAGQMIRQSGDVARRAAMMQTMMRRQRVSQLVQVVATTPATVEDLNQLAGIAEDAQQQGLDAEQVEAKIRESTPFAGLAQLLKDREVRKELYDILVVLLTALTLMATIRASQPAPTLSPEQVEQIVEQVVERVGDGAPAEAPTTTAKAPPHCD
jgi:hypothetical protein